ncbi:hypothetical protein LINPERPRIM_LOCUS30482 [Linum perenne]
MTGVGTTYRCISYHLLGTRLLHPPSAGVVQFSHGCIGSWAGRSSSLVAVRGVVVTSEDLLCWSNSGPWRDFRTLQSAT